MSILIERLQKDLFDIFSGCDCGNADCYLLHFIVRTLISICLTVLKLRRQNHLTPDNLYLLQRKLNLFIFSQEK
ncbi:unnamed protein product [Schistosoma rodhaini]|uniref:Uncharacterized protein n=1 Tax=Schistosoma rodhaini TaxID=6188 RepID=A0AA85G865_9TREM|nr:unnamed protein product [Schistosoma rodhaini]